VQAFATRLKILVMYHMEEYVVTWGIVNTYLLHITRDVYVVKACEVKNPTSRLY
jgi:hypothetical protein